MPPLIAYRFKPTLVPVTCSEKNLQARQVFYGWNNLNDFEKRGMNDVRNWLRENKNMEIPADFSDRDLLKFVEGEWFKVPKAGEKLYQHLLWLDSLPKD